MNRKLTLVLKALPVAMLFACATTYTSVDRTWKSPNYGQMKNVMVIGIAREQATRRDFEDDFVKELKKRGVSATPSYTVIPGDQIPSKDVLANQLKDKTIDTVLITRVTDRKDVQTYVPGTPGPYYSYWDYYGYGWNHAYSPGYTVQEEKVVLETNLYNVGNETLAWTATSNTTTSGDRNDVIRSFIPAIVNKMAKDKLF